VKVGGCDLESGAERHAYAMRQVQTANHQTGSNTSCSAREMQLKPGQTAAALIKATEVMILRI
jgi:hypothetical protein